jgi:hypothetical protein
MRHLHRPTWMSIAFLGALPSCCQLPNMDYGVFISAVPCPGQLAVFNCFVEIYLVVIASDKHTPSSTYGINGLLANICYNIRVGYVSDELSSGLNLLVCELCQIRCRHGYCNRATNMSVLTNFQAIGEEADWGLAINSDSPASDEF